MKTVFSLTVVASCLAGTIAVAGPQYGPGVTDTEIKLGQTLPFSGAVSAIGIPMAGATQALLRKVNEAGGINGRKVNLLSLDDGFSAPKTVEQTRRLVEGDEVLAIVGSFGSSPNAAIQKYLNAKKVPQLFIMSGSSRFLAPKEFPWTMPFPVSSERIGRAYGRFVRQSKPDAKVSIISQNDEYGRQVIHGIREGLGADADKVIIAERSYEVTDPTLDSQMASLKASEADVLFHVSIPKFAAQGLRKVSELGWRPLQFVDLSVCIDHCNFQAYWLGESSWGDFGDVLQGSDGSEMEGRCCGRGLYDDDEDLRSRHRSGRQPRNVRLFDCGIDRSAATAMWK